MKNKDVYRFDRIDAPEWLIENFKTDGTEGFLTGKATVTNIGVFEYQNADGSIRRELRTQDNVFDIESVKSLRMKPMTNDHPPEMITMNNIKEYQVGTTGGSPDTDGMHLAIDLSITDPKTIQDIQNGKQELSAGYRATIIEDSGVWMGVPYDAIQTNIRYNHVAVVDKARAGDAARIKLRTDSADAVCVGRIDNMKKEDIKMSDKETVSIRIDGINFQVNPTIGAHINNLASRADNLKKEKESATAELNVLTKEHETLKGKFDGVTEQLKTAGDIAPKKLKEAVKQRMIVMDAAIKAGVEIKEDFTDRECKEAVIVATFPREDETVYKEVLKEHSDDYINGKFDTAVDELNTRKGNNEKNDEKIAGSIITKQGNENKDDLNNLLALKKDNMEKQAEWEKTICNNWNREA